jgi:gamma-glutamyl-gamma-aminobutyrate hydrolase PuuD
MTTPIIGISTYHAQADWRGWAEEGALLPWVYVTQVHNAGAMPVLLPPVGTTEEAEATVARLDGVVIAGGSDIGPEYYDAVAKHPETAVTAPDRDVWELAVAKAALQLHVPLLGICRGMQILNVASGGTLHQHIPDLVGHHNHSGTSEGFGVHKVRVTSGKQLLSILPDGGQFFDVPTHHHQSVEKVGDNLRAVAWAEDGIVEAVEGTNPDEFIVGVQWHPEQGTDPRLFQALVTAAEAHSSERIIPAAFLAGA